MARYGSCHGDSGVKFPTLSALVLILNLFVLSMVGRDDVVWLLLTIFWAIRFLMEFYRWAYWPPKDPKSPEE